MTQEPDVSPQWQQQEAIRSPDSPARSPHLQDGACHRPRVPHPRRARQGRKRTRPQGVPPLPRRSSHRPTVVLDGIPQGQEVRRLEDARSQDQGGEDSAVRFPFLVCASPESQLVLIALVVRAQLARSDQDPRGAARARPAKDWPRRLWLDGGFLPSTNPVCLHESLTCSTSTSRLTRPGRCSSLSKLSAAQAAVVNPKTKEAVGPIPHIDFLLSWYGRNLPGTAANEAGNEIRTGGRTLEARIVHGDFKIDNMVSPSP